MISLSMASYMQHTQSVCLNTFGLKVAAYVLTITGVNTPSVLVRLV
jgi:hypothetical protein